MEKGFAVLFFFFLISLYLTSKYWELVHFDYFKVYDSPCVKVQGWFYFPPSFNNSHVKCLQLKIVRNTSLSC